MSKESAHRPRALTVKDVAARIGQTDEFVRRLIKAGKLRGYRPGGGRRAEWCIDDVDLEHHIEAWKTQSAPKASTSRTATTRARFVPPTDNVFA